MLRRIPLVAVLALFVAVSCDRSFPTATDDSVPESPTLQILENEWYTWTGWFDICTERLDVVQRYKYQEKLTETPSGNWAYQEKLTIHGTAVGQTTGNEYVWNNVNIIWLENGGENKAYNDHYIDTWHIIGKGQAPDFHIKVDWAINFNANGDLVVEFENYRETCD